MRTIFEYKALCVYSWTGTAFAEPSRDREVRATAGGELCANCSERRLEAAAAPCDPPPCLRHHYHQGRVSGSTCSTLHIAPPLPSQLQSPEAQYRTKLQTHTAWNSSHPSSPTPRRPQRPPPSAGAGIPPPAPSPRLRLVFPPRAHCRCHQGSARTAARPAAVPSAAPTRAAPARQVVASLRPPLSPWTRLEARGAGRRQPSPHPPLTYPQTRRARGRQALRCAPLTCPWT